MRQLQLHPYKAECPSPTDWVWLLVAWQWFQILVLLAQDRINPAFL